MLSLEKIVNTPRNVSNFSENSIGCGYEPYEGFTISMVDINMLFLLYTIEKFKH